MVESTTTSSTTTTCIDTAPCVQHQLLLHTERVKGRDGAGCACIILVGLHEPSGTTRSTTNEVLLVVTEAAHHHSPLNLTHTMQLSVADDWEEGEALGITGRCVGGLDIQVKGGEDAL